MKRVKPKLTALACSTAALIAGVNFSSFSGKAIAPSSANTLSTEQTSTGATGDYTIAAAGNSIVEKVLSEKINNVNTDKYGRCGGRSHMQGACVDSEFKYMYFSYTDVLAKVEISTGKLVATVVGFDGHIGCLDYYDGYVYASLPTGTKSYLAIFDPEKLTSVGMNIKTMTNDDAVAGVLLDEPTKRERDAVDPNLFIGQSGDAYGHYLGNTSNDGVTIGKWPGGNDDELYLITTTGTLKRQGAPRYDNMYTAIYFYKLSDIWQEEGNPWKRPFSNARALEENIEEGEALSAAKIMYVFHGNMNYSIQNIEYEWDTGDLSAYCYESIDGFSESMFVIDGSVEPTYKTLELGQNNEMPSKVDRTYAKWLAEAYATDANKNGRIEENEYLKGYVASLKCICGNEHRHSAEYVGDEKWGYTGLKKADQPICSLPPPGNASAAMMWIGSPANDTSVDYFFACLGATEVRLYKRSVLNTGMTFELVNF